MPPASAQPLLPADSTTGLSYHRQLDISPHHVRDIMRPSAIRSRPPITFPGNMLGARARAAEYHAAKAASARQQASREAEEQDFPQSTPVSLSAFTRNASTSRNKGVKVFKPLILSEDEEEDTNDADIEGEIHRSPTSQLESTHIPRAASLPPPHSNFGALNQAMINVQTPFRYREAPVIPYAPRAMISDNGYGFQPHSSMQFHSHYLPAQYLQGIQGFIGPHVMSTPNIGWYTSSEDFGFPYSSPHAGIPPSTPVPPLRPAIPQAKSFEFAALAKKKPSNGTLNESSAEGSPDNSKLTLKLGGPTLHVFGPDDLSPTKMELKFRAREEGLLHETEIHPTPARPSNWNLIGATELQDAAVASELTQFESGHPDLTAFTSRKELTTIKDLLVNRNIISSIKPSRDSIAECALQRLDFITKNANHSNHLCREADWPYLGRHNDSYDRDMDRCVSPVRVSNISKAIDTTEKAKMKLLESMRAKTDSSSSVRPPPGLEQSRSGTSSFAELESEQVTGIKFPLVDMNSLEWLEIRMPTEAERDRMKRVCHAARTCSISDKYQDQWEDRRGIKKEDLESWLEVSQNQYVKRRYQIDELVGEMQRKWEYGGSFRSASMTRAEAQKHATTVKAIGSIMSTLNMQVEDKSGCYHRGSRPYCSPPAYAIEKSVGLDKDKRSNSLFEPDGDTNRIAPPRLARDPRFRPQLGEAIALEEGRIPRMFVSRRI